MDQIAGQLKSSGLVLTHAQWQQLRAEAERFAPEEACGLLAGIDDRVQAVIPVTNELHSTVRYRMEPTEQLKAFIKIEQQGWELIGIYHTHPNGPAEPSQTDIAEAFYPDTLYLILSGQLGEWKFRGFFIRSGKVHEMPIRVDA